MNEEKGIPLGELPINDLIKLNEQSKQKSEFLGTAMGQLRDIKGKFGQTLEMLKGLETKMQENTSLIPLTTNLYVPGKLKNPDKVIISIGTGYFAEMSVEQAQKFAIKRIEYLNKKLDQLADANFQSLMVAQATQKTIESKEKESIDRPKTCVYFQKGSCIKGDDCEFNHPSVRCHTFQAIGWCPYGHSCHFWHDYTLIIAKTIKAIPQKICSFYLNNQCRYGDKCSYSHDLENYNKEQDKSMTLEEYRAQQRTQRQRSSSRSSNGSWRNFSNYQRIDRQNSTSSNVQVSQVQTRPNSIQRASISLSREELFKLNNLEIDLLLKKYPPSKIRKLTETENDRSYTVIFSPDDPDWPFDVREFNLLIKINRMYPMEALCVQVLENDVIMKGCLDYLNESITNWISCYHKRLVNQGRVELYLRTFFTWLNRSLEALLETGLHKLQTSQELAETTHTLDYTTDSENEGEDEAVESGFEDQNGNDQDSVLRKNSRSSFEMLESIENLEKEQKQSLLLSAFSVPTQRVRLDDLHLGEKILAGVVRQLPVVITCLKCKQSFDWTFNLPGGNNIHIFDLKNPKEISFLSMGPYHIKCSKCSETLSMSYRSQHVVRGSNISGTISVNNCKVVQIPDQKSNILLQCIVCNTFTKLQNMTYLKTNRTLCSNCNAELTFEFSVISIGTITASIKKCHSIPNGKVTEANKKLKSSKSPCASSSIILGQPLPNFGTCSHYKQSHRWLRFPCCNQAFPCDICHEDAVARSPCPHDIINTTRMICGFCAREQEFTANKPCVDCGKNLIKNNKTFWEGGMGCRNKTLMSRKDPHKYKQ